jgi:hypothetical protein
VPRFGGNQDEVYGHPRSAALACNFVRTGVTPILDPVDGERVARRVLTLYAAFAGLAMVADNRKAAGPRCEDRGRVLRLAVLSRRSRTSRAFGRSY